MWWTDAGGVGVLTIDVFAKLVGTKVDVIGHRHFIEKVTSIYSIYLPPNWGFMLKCYSHFY